MKVKYNWPDDWSALGQDFIKTFHTSIVNFYDPLMSYVNQKFTLRLCAFDDYLHSQFGDYEDQKLSMKDVVDKYYGTAGINLIEKLI